MFTEKDKKKLIYLAGPYTHDDKQIQEFRYLQLSYVSAKLEKMGITNLSPITHSHIQNLMIHSPGSWEYWKKTDLLFISRCDEVWVLMLDGWKESVGVQDEVIYAKENNIPVRYIKHMLVKNEIKEVKRK